MGSGMDTDKLAWFIEARRLLGEALDALKSCLPRTEFWTDRNKLLAGEIDEFLKREDGMRETDGGSEPTTS